MAFFVEIFSAFGLTIYEIKTETLCRIVYANSVCAGNPGINITSLDKLPPDKLFSLFERRRHRNPNLSDKTDKTD